jgi:hypothetical protein
VDDLFEVACIDAGALTLELRPADLSALVRASVAGLAADADARDLAALDADRHVQARRGRAGGELHRRGERGARLAVGDRGEDRPAGDPGDDQPAVDPGGDRDLAHAVGREPLRGAPGTGDEPRHVPGRVVALLLDVADRARAVTAERHVAERRDRRRPVDRLG